MVLRLRPTPTQFQTYRDEQHTLAFYIKCVPPVGWVLLLRKWVLTISPPFNEEMCGCLEVKAVIYSNLDVGEWSAYRRVTFPTSIKARLTCKGPNIVRKCSFASIAVVRNYDLLCVCLMYSLSQGSLEVRLKQNVHSKFEELTKLPSDATVTLV